MKIEKLKSQVKSWTGRAGIWGQDRFKKVT